MKYHPKKKKKMEEEEEEEEEGWVGLAVMLSLASPQIPTTGMMTQKVGKGH